MKELATIRLLLPLLRRYSYGVPAMVLLGTLSTLAEGLGISLFAPLLEALDPQNRYMDGFGMIRSAIDTLVRYSPVANRLVVITAAVLLLTICKAALAYMDAALGAYITSRITHGLRSNVFRRLMAMTPDQMDHTASGRLLNLLGTETWRTSDAVGLFVNLIVSVCAIIVLSGLLLSLSWHLTCIVVVGVVLISLLLNGVGAGARALGKQSVEANAALSDQMLDGLYGLEVLQMFGLRGNRQRLFDTTSDKVRSIHLRLDLRHRSLSPLSEILYVGLLLAILVCGVGFHYSVPSIAVFVLLLYRLQPHIRQFDGARLGLISLATSVEDTVRFSAAAESFEVSSKDIPSPHFHRTIRFEGVRFFYETESGFALDNVSFSIPQGQTTAILGPSGSGKSTLVNLICRLREPLCGEILVDGKPLSAIDVDQWRERIALVSQDTWLFNETVRENIRFGKLGATDAEVVEAAIAADADGFIRDLAQGYDTPIGNAGVSLSGGQRQRIALARAFLRKPEILILDEATSAIDSISEDCIQQCLQQADGRQTVIVISHRLSTVKYASHVIVLRDGQVTEEGSPSDLLSRGGFFTRLKELQNVQ